MESSPTGIRNVKWGLIGALSIVFILTIASLSIAISVREGNLVDNSIGNNLIKNNQKFIFRGVTVEGDTTLGENNTDKITFNADVESNFVPNDDITFDLGSDSKRWRNIYADKLIGGVSVSAGVSSIGNASGGLSITPGSGTGAVDIGLSLGSGLAIVNQGLSVQLGTGLAFDNNNIILQKPLGEAYIGSGDVVTVGSGDVIPFDTYGTNRNISTGISGFITDTAGYYMANAYFGASSATTIGSSLVLQRFDGGSATNIIIEQTYSAATARINGLVYANSGSCFNIINNGPADFIFSNVGTSTATKFEMIYMSN